VVLLCHVVLQRLGHVNRKEPLGPALLQRLQRGQLVSRGPGIVVDSGPKVLRRHRAVAQWAL
jgi:hypothetical protein